MSGSVTLTAEQRERMERNRREALAKLAARQARQAQEEREKPLIKSTSDLPATTSTAQKFPAVTAVTRAVNKPIPEKNGSKTNNQF